MACSGKESCSCCCAPPRSRKPLSPNLPSGPSVVGMTETAALKFQRVRRLPNGNFAAALGDNNLAGDDVVGVFANDYAAGDMAIVAKTGATVSGAGLQSGSLYSDANGMPEIWSNLPVVAFPNQKYTTRLGVGSAAGLDVDLGQTEPIA